MLPQTVNVAVNYANDVVSVESPGIGLPRIPASVDGYVKHVLCEGAREHVVSYDSAGPRCSVENCILNQRRNKNETPL